LEYELHPNQHGNNNGHHTDDTASTDDGTNGSSIVVTSKPINNSPLQDQDNSEHPNNGKTDNNDIGLEHGDTPSTTLEQAQDAPNAEQQEDPVANVPVGENNAAL
jgi:hypothetical protein